MQFQHIDKIISQIEQTNGKANDTCETARDERLQEIFTDDDGEDSDHVEVEKNELGVEVTALYFEGAKLGCARFIQSECCVEAFEVYVSANPELAGGRKGKSGGSSGADAFVLLSEQDIPNSLLWFARYLRIKRPTLLLPHDHDTNVIANIVQLIGGCEIIFLNRKTAFDARQLTTRFQTMYPNMQNEEIESRFKQQHVKMRCALSALLHFVSAVKSNIYNIVETAPFQVLYVEPEVSEVLQFTRTELHPCDYQGIGKSKEGFSLFSFLDCTQSPLGRMLLRQWFALPSCDLAEIQRRQSVVQYFTDTRRRELLQHTRRAIHRVKPSGRIFTLIRQGKAGFTQYQTLFQSIRSILTVYDLLVPYAHELPFLFEVVNSFDVDELSKMAFMLENIIEGVGGRNSSHHASNRNLNIGSSNHMFPKSGTHIAVHVDSDPTGLLRELKARVNDLGNSLSVYAGEAFSRLSVNLQNSLNIQCLYLHPYGYLLSVDGEQLLFACQDEMEYFYLNLHNNNNVNNNNFAPPEASMPAGFPDGSSPVSNSFMQEEVQKDEDFCSTEQRYTGVNQSENMGVLNFMKLRYGWTLHHQDGSMYFFKTQQMIELDAVVGDLQARIYQREDEIRGELDDAMLYRSLYLLPPSRVLAELDCLLCFTFQALQHNWCCPQFDSQQFGYLCISEGWHPLLQHTIDARVLTPFNLNITNRHERVCIVTGANQTGKSIFLGAVAQIVFLAHLGCYVPAGAVKLSLFSGIFSTVSAAAKIGATNSSFTEECSSLNRILRFCEASRLLENSDAVSEEATAAVKAASTSIEEIHPEERVTEGANVGAPLEIKKDQHTPAVRPGPLILFDEFGRGTAPEDGKALLGSTIRYFAGTLPEMQHESNQPDEKEVNHKAVVLFTTHFTEIFDEAIAQDALYAKGGEVTDFPLRFPFEHIQWYTMRCTPIFEKDQEGPMTSLLNEVYRPPDEHRMEGSPREESLFPVDAIPSFIPYQVTRVVGKHKESIIQYREAEKDILQGPMLGRQCGLPEELVEMWEDCLRLIIENEKPRQN